MNLKALILLTLLFATQSVFSFFLWGKVKKIGWETSDKTCAFWGAVTIFSLLTLPLLHESIINNTFEYTTLIIIASIASFMALFALFLSKGSQKKLEQLIFFTIAISSALLVFYSFKKFPAGREATHSPSNIILAPYWVFLILIVFVILEKKFLLPHARKSKAFYVSYAYIWFSIWTLSFFFMITHTSILSLAALINFVALLRIAFDFLLIKVPPIHHWVTK